MMSCKLRLPLVSLCLLAILFIVSPAVAEAAPPPDEQQATTAAPAATGDQAAAVASRCARCGDGYCARSCENEFTCPADCAPQPKVEMARCGKCGDGQCVASCGETATSCPVDCGGVPVPRTAATTEAQECKTAQSADSATPAENGKKN
jgi:hypothetical protein